MKTSRAVALCLAVGLVLMLIVGCAPAKQAAMAPAAPPPGEAPAAPSGGPDAVSGGESAKAAAPEQAANAAANRKIVTTGNMTLEVRDLTKAVNELNRLVRENGGFYANKTLSAEEVWRHAELVIRVPAANFDKLHDGARALGTIGTTSSRARTSPSSGRTSRPASRSARPKRRRWSG